MDIRTISPHFSVSPQIQISDLAMLSAMGFKSIVNNRPDGETDDQPLSDDLAAEAGRLGLDYRDIPIIPGMLSDAIVEQFKVALTSFDAPVLAFCRTGTRSTALWALHSATHLSVDSILDTVRAAGYDLDTLRPRLQDRSNQG